MKSKAIFRDGDTMSIDDDRVHDIAIIGAGPAGSICAISALTECPDLDIALIDRAHFPRDKSCGDAIGLHAVSVIRRLGLDGVFDQRESRRTFNFRLPPGYRGPLPISKSEADLREEMPDFFVIKRRHFDNVLFEAARDRGANCFTGWRLSDAERCNGVWRITLTDSDGTTTHLDCRMLVGADGASSKVRRLAGLPMNDDETMAVGIRAYARIEGLPMDVMRLDFMASTLPGFGWLFPLQDNTFNIGVGMHAPDFKRTSQSLSSYLGEYVEFLRDQGATLDEPQEQLSHPLPTGANPVPIATSPGLALIGDAASMINPLTGEGIHYAAWAGDQLGTRLAKQMARNGNPDDAARAVQDAYGETFSEFMRLDHKLLRSTRFFVALDRSSLDRRSARNAPVNPA